MRIDVLKSFRYLPTESNGQLSEYLSWHRKRIDEILNWISIDNCFHGETRGILSALHRE